MRSDCISLCSRCSQVQLSPGAVFKLIVTIPVQLVHFKRQGLLCIGLLSFLHFWGMRWRKHQTQVACNRIKENIFCSTNIFLGWSTFKAIFTLKYVTFNNDRKIIFDHLWTGDEHSHFGRRVHSSQLETKANENCLNPTLYTTAKHVKYCYILKKYLCFYWT